MAKQTKNSKEKDEQPSGTSSSIATLTSILKDNKDDYYKSSEKRTWKCSTGSLLLDAATGGVRPGLWRIAGNNNQGKTPQTLEIIRNLFETVPNSKCVWMMAEGRLSEENMERCGLTFIEEENIDKWVSGTVFLLRSNIFELFIKLVKDLVKNNPDDVRYAFVVDSIDGLMLRDDAIKDITENNRVAGVPMLAKKMMQSLSLGMSTYGHWMGLISQVTAEIKLDPYAKSPNRGGNFSGGNSLLHGADVIIQYEQSFMGDFILDGAGKMNDGKTKVIGQNVKVTMVKSLLETTKKTTVTYPIKYGRKPSGIWIEREIGDMILAWGLAIRGGAWITISAALIDELKEHNIEFPDKVQGLDNLYQLFEDNIAAKDYLFTKFTKLLE